MQIYNKEKIYYHVDKLLVDRGKSYLFPKSIEIQPTAECNLACHYCIYKKRNESNKLASQTGIDGQVMKEVCLNLGKLGTESVVISGGGEPLRYQHIVPMIETLYSSNISLGMNSNGMNYATMSKIAHMFDYITISFHEHPDHNEKIVNMHVKDFISKLKPKCLNTTFGGKLICTDKNISHISERVSQLVDSELDYIVCQVELSEISQKTKVNQQTFLELKKIQKEFASTKRVLFKFEKQMNFASMKCFCIEYNLPLTITPNGNVYNCLADIASEALAIGNINDQSIESIYTSTKNEEIQQVLQKRYLNKECKNCRFDEYNTEYQKSINKAKNTQHVRFL